MGEEQTAGIYRQMDEHGWETVAHIDAYVLELHRREERDARIEAALCAFLVAILLTLWLSSRWLRHALHG